MFSGGSVFWFTKKQQLVSGSSTKSEYKASTSEALWLMQLMKDLQISQGLPLTLYSDSHSAIALAKNLVYHSKSKHIDVSYHFTREQVQAGAINLEYCPSKDNLADMFTKALNGKQLKIITERSGIGPPTGVEEEDVSIVSSICWI